MKKILFMALMVVFLASGALAQEKKTIVIATDATWPPLEFLNTNNEPMGFSVNYMEAAAHEGGYEVKIINVPWSKIFAGLNNEEFDAICSSVTITDERKNAMDFSAPYFSTDLAILVPEDSQVKSLADLEGKKAGGQADTTGIFVIKSSPDIELATYDELELAVEDLYNGRLDAVVCDTPVAANIILLNEKYKDKFKIAVILDQKPGDEDLYGVAVKKGNKEVLDMINKGIAGVKAKGIDKELIKQWITVE